MKILTALFVGLGSIGTRHLNNLAALCADRGWTLEADALRSDPARPLRPGVAEQLHAQYTNAAALPGHYDLIFITNPTSLHAQALRDVYGRAGALFIEKPIFSAEQTDLDLADFLPAGQKACGGPHALVRHHAGAERTAALPAALLRPGHLFQLPAGLAPRGGLPHGVQRPQSPGRRRDH